MISFRVFFSRACKAASRIVLQKHATLSDSSRYQKWLVRTSPSVEELARMTEMSASFSYRPVISVVTPVYNTDGQWLRACIESVRHQAYPYWQLCLCDDGSTRVETREALRRYDGESRITIVTLPSNAGISAASNAALAAATGEFVAFLDHDDELTPNALFELVSYLNGHPETDFLYSDEDKLDLDGARCDPFFKPDWSPEHFLSAMYTCHLMVVRRALLTRIGGFRAGYEGAQDYDLVLRLIECAPRICHVPKVLYHWRKLPQSAASARTAKPWAHDAGKLGLEDYLRRNRLDAEVLPGAVPNLYRVRFVVKDEPLVSIILPSEPDCPGADRRRLQALECSIRTLTERTTYRRFEVLLATGDGRMRDSAAHLLREVPCRAVPVNGSCDVARQLNVAATQACGSHLLFFDWGLAALESDWLTALIEYSQQSAIGAVGGKLLYPDGRLKHVGILVGVNGAAAPALHRHPGSSYGYSASAIGVRNYSAVSRICMMTRRAVFDQVGGFHEEFHRHFADVDYCLRVTAAGYRVVFTPYAAFVHDELPPDRSAGKESDAARLRASWGNRLDHDPYYNLNFTRESPDYEPAVRRDCR